MSTPSAALGNAGHLKLDLCIQGVRLDSQAQVEALCVAHVGDEMARVVELVLPEDVWVTAPLIVGPAHTTPFLLSPNGDGFMLQREDTQVSVRLIAPPHFYQRPTTRGTPMSRVARAYGSCIAVNPRAACGHALRGAVCTFCQSGTRTPIDEFFAVSPQEVTEVVGAAFDEGVAEFVYFNVGHFDTEDGGIQFLEPYIRTIKRHFDTLVAVQIHPPKTNSWIDRTYAMGVDALSYNVEVYDADVLEGLCPGRTQHLGRERYYEALRHAATIFPSGTVWSELVVGLEPVASTMRGIDALTELRVLPVLSVLHTSQMHPGEGLIWDDIAPVYAHLFHAVRNARINMGWIRDLSFAITPLEARFFAGDEARMAVAMQQFYRSRIGTLTARNLARLRRRLRVRRVSDSFDSSHL